MSPRTGAIGAEARSVSLAGSGVAATGSAGRRSGSGHERAAGSGSGAGVAAAPSPHGPDGAGLTQIERRGFGTAGADSGGASRVSLLTGASGGCAAVERATKPTPGALGTSTAHSRKSGCTGLPSDGGRKSRGSIGGAIVSTLHRSWKRRLRTGMAEGIDRRLARDLDGDDVVADGQTVPRLQPVG